MKEPGLDQSIAEIERHYRHRLHGVVLFGSRAGHRPRQESDWDLLVVLGEDEPIRRSLYHEWDVEMAPRVEKVLPRVSPHFVHLPAEGIEPSSLWLEVALAHIVLHDPTKKLGGHLRRVRQLIDAGRFERRAVHGLPYWRRAG